MSFFRVLYAFHNRNFRVAFKKTLSRYFVCCRGRRKSTTSSAALPPATPSGESQRPSANIKRLKKTKIIRSLTSIYDRPSINDRSSMNDRPSMNKNPLSRGNNVLGASNGNLAAGEYSLSSKRNSCL